MASTELEFNFPSDSTDERGQSFSLSESELNSFGSIQDVHIAAIQPGKVRGNHYHMRRGELIAVVYTDDVSVHWDTGSGTDPLSRKFTGSGCVSFAPPNGWSHAVRNDGRSIVWIFVASDQPYEANEGDAGTVDAIRRVVTD
ncbi:MAG: hypothetical protein QOI06_2874 [Nocardioidaceae bacterium]|jgi:dTDP-4-dehydrorhamnose 3,5-epimerase-like enzyme|nr:hypothetical protein [Nocardioidaceae bacterium]